MAIGKFTIRVVTLCASVLAVPACGPGAGRDPGPAADLVLVNGAFYTVDAARRWVEAVAVRDGRLSYVGNDAGALALAGPATPVIDLGGHMVLPGIHDVHIHPVTSGVDMLACDLTPYTTTADYLTAIEGCATRKPDAEWITGSGWLMSTFGPGARASRTLIDGVVPDRPVFLESADGHSAWVNSKALEIAGIAAATPDPDGGRIDREADGETPLGSLQENATELVERYVPDPGPAGREAGLRFAIDMLSSYGVTSIQEAMATEQELQAYRTLDERGELDLRVVAAMLWDRERGLEQIDDLIALRDEYTGGRLRSTAVKFWYDGVMENYTALMLEPYLGQNGGRGISMLDPDVMRRAVSRLDAAGFQVHFHAIGDAAVRDALDAIEAARNANGDRDSRHHIAHLELIDPVDIPRFRELGAAANFQPLWAYPDAYITDLTVPFIGPERSHRLYPIGSMYRSGAVIAFGSDWSVSTANPFHQIETAILRRDALDASGDMLLPEQAIALPEAIAAFTINGAWVNHSERDTGSIETGKFADLVVLDRNLFEIPPEDISETRALLTLLEGRVVFGRLDRFRREAAAQ